MVDDKFLQLAFAHSTLFSHTCGYITDDFIAHSQPKTKRSYLPARGLCGCVLFSLFFFHFLIVIHRTVIPTISSLACVRFDISRMERLHYFFFSSFPPPVNYYNWKVVRWCFTLEPLERLFRVRIHARTAIYSARARERVYTFITRHFLRRHAYQFILSRVIIAVARSNYSLRPLSGILSVF